MSREPEAEWSVRFVASEAEIADDLWAVCFTPPREGRWWYRSLERSELEDQFTFFYALIEQNGVPIGIAPLFTARLPLDVALPDWLKTILRPLGKTLASLTHPQTLFVGSPCSEQGSVGMRDSTERRAAFLALQDALEREAARRGLAMIVWKDFEDADRADLDWLASQRRLFAMRSLPSTVVALGSDRKEDYYAALKASQRGSLRRRIRRSMERVELDTEVIRHPDDAALDQLFALFWQTYERSQTKFERLTRRFFGEIAEAPAASFLLLRERSTRAIVAFRLSFTVGERIINKFIGIDYARPREWMLYFRLWDAGLDWALSQHARTIQSGQTGYAAKLETGHRLVPLTNYCMHRNATMHRIFRAAAGLIERLEARQERKAAAQKATS
jgi:hypothetical protein